MARFFGDSVANTTTGTASPWTLSTTSITGHRTMQTAGISVNDIFVYRIAAVDGSGVETGTWEVGLGTYTADTLTRTTFLASSTGSAVTFAAGTKNVYVVASGYDLINRARFFNGAPLSSDGFDGDYGFRVDGAMAGTILQKASGVWSAVTGNAVTWAARPAANQNVGGIITVTDLGDQDFYSDGTNWIPVGKRLVFSSAADLNAARTTGTAASQTAVNFNIPAGLVLPGARYEIDFEVEYAGGGAAGTAKSVIFDDPGGVGGTYSRTGLNNNLRVIADQIELLVDDQSTNVTWLKPAGYTAGTMIAGTTTAMTTGTLDLALAHTYRIRVICPTDDSWRVFHRFTIHYK